MAQYWDVKAKFERNDPITTTRIYWCVGFGNTPEELSQQVTIKNIFQAIFNIAKKPRLSPSLEEKGALDKNTSLSTTIPIEPIPLPPFIHQLLELAKVSKHDHPSRKLPIMNAFYEDPPPEDNVVQIHDILEFEI